jgi:hypothetical protein
MWPVFISLLILQLWAIEDQTGDKIIDIKVNTVYEHTIGEGYTYKLKQNSSSFQIYSVKLEVNDEKESVEMLVQVS